MEYTWLPNLGGCVVFWLRIASDDRPPLVRIDELRCSVKNDTCRACVYKSLDSTTLRCLKQVLGPSNVDFLVDLRLQVEMW
jgi:hypothetical protein